MITETEDAAGAEAGAVAKETGSGAGAEETGSGTVRQELWLKVTQEPWLTDVCVTVAYFDGLNPPGWQSQKESLSHSGRRNSGPLTGPLTGPKSHVPWLGSGSWDPCWCWSWDCLAALGLGCVAYYGGTGTSNAIKNVD